MNFLNSLFVGLKNSLIEDYEVERRKEIEEDKKKLAELELLEKNIRERIAKIVSFIHARPALEGLFMQKYATYQPYIAEAPQAYIPKESGRHELLERITSKKIEIVRLNHYVREFLIFMKSYPDLLQHFQDETKQEFSGFLLE